MGESPKQEARQWFAPAEQPAKSRISPIASPPKSPDAGEQRRWLPSAPEAAPTAPTSAPQRQWTAAPTPSPPSSKPLVQSGVSSSPEGQTRLELKRHEQIDFSELTQNECLGSGGFGAVYRGMHRGKEVAIKKLFVEDGGNISPLQLEELEKEIAALRGLDH